MPDAPADHDGELLCAFLRDRDHPCPECNYNLRNLERVHCPECDTPLRLQVGRQRAHLVPLVLTITPCTFSLICACFLLFAMVMSNEWDLVPVLLCSFGLLSGLFGLGLLRSAQRFTRWNSDLQKATTVIVWFIHILALAFVIAFTAS